MQETHVAISVAGHYGIDGFDLTSHSSDVKHGRATYMHANISDAIPPSSSSFYDVIQVGSFRIANLYKPPSVHGDQQVLPIFDHPAIFVGDFNADLDDGDKQLIDCAINDFVLIHSEKQHGKFFSARWSKEYSPNLCWLSLLDGHPHPVAHIILDNFLIANIDYP